MTAFQAPEEFSAIDDSKLVFKKTTVIGSGPVCSRSNTTVFVHYKGSLFETGEVFDSSLDRGDPLSFKLGQGQVIKGWDLGIATMKVGEKAELLIKSEYAYGVQGSPPKIPANAILLFAVELVSVDISTADLTIAEKVEQAIPLKDEGNALFKANDIANAISKYLMATQLLSNTFGAEGSEKESIADLNVSLWSNLAAAYLKVKQAKKAEEACEKVLEWNPTHAKAVYRLSQAEVGLRQFDQAVKVLEDGRAVLVDVDVDMEISKIQKLRQLELASEKKVYSKMFA